MARFNALRDEWNIHPPLPLMVAAYLGVKPRLKMPSKKPDFAELPDIEE